MKLFVLLILFSVMVTCNQKPSRETVLKELKGDSVFKKYVEYEAKEIAIFQRSVLSDTFLQLAKTRDKNREMQYFRSIRSTVDTFDMHRCYDKLFYKYVRQEGFKKKEFDLAIGQAVIDKGFTY